MSIKVHIISLAVLVFFGLGEAAGVIGGDFGDEVQVRPNVLTQET